MKEVFQGLSQEDRNHIFWHPNSTEHHFGLGLYIRNNYIHGKDLPFAYLQADSLSSEITARIASMIIDNYDYENLFYRNLYENFVFNHLRRLYYDIKGECPDSLMDQYSDFPNEDTAAEAVIEEVKNVVLWV